MYICIYNCIWLQIATLPLTSSKEIIPYTQLPGLMSVMMYYQTRILLQIATLPLTSSKEIIPYTQLPGLMSVMMYYQTRILLQIATLPLTSSKEIIPYTQLPGLMSVMMLESSVSLNTYSVTDCHIAVDELQGDYSVHTVTGPHVCHDARVSSGHCTSFTRRNLHQGYGKNFTCSFIPLSFSRCLKGVWNFIEDFLIEIQMFWNKTGSSWEWIVVPSINILYTIKERGACMWNRLYVLSLLGVNFQIK